MISLPKHALPLLAFAALVTPASASLDANQNGVSDVWERAVNGGNLFATFDPDADPDQDGWTNAQEAVAGTDPFDANSPAGLIKPVITPQPDVPSVFTLRWKPANGKVSDLYMSPDLQNWTFFDTFPATGEDIQIGVDATNEDDTLPGKMFWRMKVRDVETGSLGLNDYETHALGIAPGFVDDNHNNQPDDWEAATAGTMSVYPPVLAARLTAKQTTSSNLYLRNDTNSAVNYNIAVTGNTGPAYSFEDSLTGSVTYSWEDISSTGTKLTTISNDDDAVQEAPFTGFTFPFYGQTFSSVFVSSNGLLTFGTGNSDYNNVALGLSAPRNAVAVFWDDMNPGESGDIYYQQFSDRFVIQFEQLHRTSTAGTMTFQAVLYSDGRIQLRYKTMNALTSSCTVGIQNATATRNLQIIYNALYLKATMGIEIRPTANFFKASSLSGVIPAKTTSTVAGQFQTAGLPPDVYNAQLSITHNGAGASPVAIPIRFEVYDSPSVVQLLSPENNSTLLEGQTVYLQATATDPEGIALVQFFDGSTKIAEVPYASDYKINAYQPGAGHRVIVARAVDVNGKTTDSPPVVVDVLPDADGDGFPD